MFFLSFSSWAPWSNIPVWLVIFLKNSIWFSPNERWSRSLYKISVQFSRFEPEVCLQTLHNNYGTKRPIFFSQREKKVWGCLTRKTSLIYTGYCFWLPSVEKWLARVYICQSSNIAILCPTAFRTFALPGLLRSALFLCDVAVVVRWPFRAGAVEYRIVRDHNAGLCTLCLRAWKGVRVEKSERACQRCSCGVLFHTRVCVFQRGVGRPLMFSSLITCTAAGNGNGTLLFSGYSQREGSTHSDLSLRWVMGVTGSVLLPWCVFLSCQRPQWNKLNSDTSLSEVPMYAHAGRRLVQYSSILSIAM